MSGVTAAHQLFVCLLFVFVNMVLGIRLRSADLHTSIFTP